MAEEIIKARVWTKVDTLENWNNNPLLLGPGEMALVTTPSGIPLNMKWGDKTERKRFSDLPFAISYDQGQFVAIDGPGELPTPESDVAYSLVGQGTYTYPGQSDIVVDEGRLGQLVYSGGEWSFIDMGPLGIKKTDVVEESNTDAVESGAVWRSLDKRYVNKGKSYPFVNQPTENIFGVRRMNNVLLDCWIDEVNSGDVVYSLTLLARESTSGNWGNGLNIRAYNKSDLSFITSLSLRSTDSELSAENLRQLNKISDGGLQTISLKIPAFGNRTFNFLIDSDEIASGEIVDASYTNDSINMYLSPSVFRKVERVPDEANLATKSEVQPLSDFVNNVNSLTINKGKEYPLINYPTDPALSARVSLLKNIILDVKVYTNRNNELYYYMGAVYKNHTTNGYGLFICRRYKDGGAVGNMRITTMGEGADNLDQESIDKLQLWENGGIQQTSLKVLNTAFGIDRLEVLIDLDETPEGYTQFGFNDNDRWAGNDFHPVAYHPARVEASTLPINSFDTFKEALQAGQTGIVKVGSMMAESIVNNVTFSGNNSSYYPSQVWNQYRMINSNSPSVGRRGEVITIKNEDGTDAVIKSFGKIYTYFGTPNVLYRTKQALDERVVTHENTKYEKLLVPRELPDHTNEASPTFRVFELDNGELLLEVRNGVKEDPESDYRGYRRQLYVTTGMKNAVGIENENGVLEIDLTGMLTRVHQFKADTGLDYDTTVSIVGRRIALSPYGLGVTGLVHYSNDYGLTWKVIFNMGVELPEFSVPYKGSVGAWPRPEDLNPPMPADMWTAGGNTNFHCHGVTIDPFMENRIWVSTGDAMSNHQGRTALWYTDDEGETWTRMQVRGANVLDSQAGLQPMGVVCTKDYVLVGSDSGTDGLYRWARSKKTDVPKLEAAWWHNDSYNVSINVIYGGSVVTKEGYIYSVFHPNTSRPDKGVVVFTSDGLLFEEVYFDEARDEPGSPMNINWGSYMGQDRFGNVYVVNTNGTVIRLY